MKHVSPSLYTRKYYLTHCSGFKEFKKTHGRLLEPRLKHLIENIKIEKNFKVLDLGCGRGELAIWVASEGSEVYGIDYSREAIKLANIALSKQPQNIKEKVSFLQMNAKKLSFADNYFDIIVSLEVWEHLYPAEQKTSLKEILRVLKSGGEVIIHTEPNRIFNQYVYRLWCYPLSSLLIFLNKCLTGKKYPNLPKWSLTALNKSRILHVNEPTYYSLKTLFCSINGLVKIESPNVIWTKPCLSWKDSIYNFVVFLYPLSCYWPFKITFGQDFLITFKKK